MATVEPTRTPTPETSKKTAIPEHARANGVEGSTAAGNVRQKNISILRFVSAPSNQCVALLLQNTLKPCGTINALPPAHTRWHHLLSAWQASIVTPGAVLFEKKLTTGGLSGASSDRVCARTSTKEPKQACICNVEQGDKVIREAAA